MYKLVITCLIACKMYNPNMPSAMGGTTCTHLINTKLIMKSGICMLPYWSYVCKFEVYVVCLWAIKHPCGEWYYEFQAVGEQQMFTL